MTLTIIIILFFTIISALAYMCHHEYKRYEDSCRLFAQRIQTPAPKDLAELRQKQAEFDDSDDRQLPMLLKRAE